LVINQCDGAATFFELQEGMDDGAILVQEPFMVKPADYAYDVEQKILLAEKNALDRWLPRIKENKIERHEQEHQKASWYGRRTPEDGWINWTIPAEDILKLIRASAAPHPGAYTFSGEHRIIIWKASRAVRDELGVVGRILSVQEDYSFVVQTGSGLVTVEEWDADAAWRPKVGMKLGFYLELENFQLKEQVKELRARLDALEKEIFNAS